MKKTISFVLCIIMAVSLLTTAAFAQGLSNFEKTLTYKQGGFTDVAVSDWFSLNVKAAYEYGLMNGVSSTSFGASSNIKLSEVIALAARLNSIYLNGTSSFLASTPWYQTYVNYAVANGIIYSTTYKDYNAYATRQQFAEILAAALPSLAFDSINDISCGAIPDVPLTGNYKAVYTLYNAGILTGKTTAGNFYPSDYILRSEVAAIITRIADEDLRVEFALDTSGGTAVGAQLWTTLSAARDEILSAVDYYNDAYADATGNNFVSSASNLDLASVHAQAAAQYMKSAADLCQTNSKYSGYYSSIYGSYQSCLTALGDISVISSASCALTSDWVSPRTLLNNCSSSLLTAYVAIKDLV